MKGYETAFAPTDTFTVQILLSTYNGEQYLREQLDCFLRQRKVNIKVLIRDDGSSDGTVQILKEYELAHGFEVIYGKNIGVNASLFQLLQCADACVDYYALSDQDDFWMEDKLASGVELLETAKEKVPLLYGSRIEVVDEALRHQFFSPIPARGVTPYNAATQNVLPGHTQIFNNMLRETVLRAPIDDVTVIDWWLYLVASGTGRVLYDSRCFVKHRQHGSNAVGYRRHGLRFFLIRLRRLKAGNANAISMQLYSFYLCYYSFISNPYLEELERYFKGLDSFLSRLRYIGQTQLYRQTTLDNLIFKLLYLVGKYKL